MRATVRKIVTASFLLSFFLAAFSQQVAKTIPYSGAPEKLIGFLEFRPTDYGSQNHPLIIFLHGVGERGNGTTQVYNVAANAIPKFCAAGASMRFTVGGVTSSFVVLSPQLSASLGYWPTYYVKEMIAYAKANLKIDPNRIYVCGLSLGGGGVWRVITETPNFDNSFDGTIAAAAPVCGTQEETDANFCNTIGYNHLPVWAFHSMDDGTVGVGATQHAQILGTKCGNISPAMKFTYYQSGGHAGAWIHAYDTGHIVVPVVVNGIVSNFTAIPNLYEWFLSHTRATGGNTPPVANAGNAQTITLPNNSITLTGIGQGTNGATISSYSWVKASGPSAGTISSSAAASTTVTGLVQGTYVFTLTVNDNHGLTSSASVTITVNAAAQGNTPPTANAGNAQTITLPNNSVILTGSGQGTNGATISSYSWVKTSGPSAGISNAGAASTAVTSLVQGTYVFTVTVKDNHGLTSSASVTITVNAAAKTNANTPPTANAGSAKTINLPDNSVILTGSGQGNNGATISSYSWVKTSGPSAGGISKDNAASTAITSLVQGTYLFTLTVKDNHGLTGSASVTVTVNAAAKAKANTNTNTNINTAPTANAGSAKTITLPDNSVILTGSGQGNNGATISSYSWVKTSGPSAGGISKDNAASTAITSLVQGSYVFTLTVKDNHGLTNSASVTVTVNPAAKAVAFVAKSNLLGYIKISVGPYQACGDASSTGRTAVYGSSISNGTVLYTDAAQTKKYNGGWNWFSITPALGSPATRAFAIYPTGNILLLRNCTGTGTRMAEDSSTTTAEEDEATLQRLKDSANAAEMVIAAGETKLNLYPNPVHTTATIELYSAEEGVKIVNLYNASGVLKAKYTWQTIRGKNVFSLKDVSGLANGLYILDIRDSNGKSHGSLKFLKL